MKKCGGARIFAQGYLSAAVAVAIVGAASTHTVAENLSLEEIVVTAQKRAQSLQDVPISVSSVSGEKLAEAGIEDIEGLSTFVPNLNVVKGGFTPTMFVRGIGSGANQGFEQSVGVYSDGIYTGRAMQSHSSFIDLERVEVLRGPQSILFGQSSIAGAISLVSAQPSDELEGMVSIKHTPKYDETELNAVLSGPLTENLSARIALRDNQEDGYVTNEVLDKDVTQVDDQAARLSLLWDASDDLTVSFKSEMSRVSREGRPTYAMHLGDFGAIPGLLQPSNPVIAHKTWMNEENAVKFDSELHVLGVEYAWGELTLNSITSYSNYQYDEDNFDADATEIDLLSIDSLEGFNQFSQELRLTSPGGETIDYVVGGFYQTNNLSYAESIDLKLSAIDPQQLLFDSYSASLFTQESETLSLFGQASWNVTDSARFTLGLRYSRDEKSAHRELRGFSLSAAPGVPQSDVLLPPIFLSVLGLPPGSTAATGLAAMSGVADHSLSGDYSKENLIPSIRFEYDWGGDILLYASYSGGYKAAGFDARGVNGWTTTNNPFGVASSGLGGDNFFFDQEEAKTIELGAKMALLDGAAELNAALFETTYTDMQMSVFNGQLSFMVDNAGKAKVRGLELDGRWRVASGLDLSASLAYLDFEWKGFDGLCPSQGSQPASAASVGNCDYSGYENNFTPEWTFNLGAQHVYSLNDNLELRSAVDINFKDNHFTAATLDKRSEQSAATLVSGRIAIASADDSWQVALLGQNLTDRDVTTFTAEIPQSNGGLQGQIMRPRTLSIEGIYRF